jgi:hypothetical protein
MRSYRLTIAERQLTDTIQRVKMRSAADNKPYGIAVDTANRQIGMVNYNDDGTVNTIEYRPLPQGVSFERPSTAASPSGVTGTETVSFTEVNGVYRMDFSSRGMPLDDWGDVNWVMIGNGRDYRAVTINTVGGLRSYTFEDNYWLDSKRKSSGSQ